MEQKELRSWEEKCIQEEPPGCQAGCPLGVNGRTFSQAMTAGDIQTAYQTLEKAMPIPGIVSHLCEGPCEQFCIRKDFGGAIALNLLEKLCIQNTKYKYKKLLIPPRKNIVTALGCGPSSLTLAYDLSRKGYTVHVYHSGDTPGGWLKDLPQDTLPEDILKKEIENLNSKNVFFHKLATFTESQLKTLDCIYFAQDDFLPDTIQPPLSPLDEHTFELSKKGWFSGGAVPKEDPYYFIKNVSQGREAATSIDRFLQGASLTASRVFPRNGQSQLFTSKDNITFIPVISPSSENSYSLEEGKLEASRCLNCQCLECVKHCKFLQNFGSYPKSYARRVYNNSSIVKGSHQANTLINSCSLCNQCEVLCPNDFSMAELCLEAREKMVEEEKMPPSAHWFALEEMRAAHTETKVTLHGPGCAKSTQLFFPGCQLNGLRPQQTIALYQHLLKEEQNTGIWLDCCGAPAHWAGRVKEYGQISSDIQQTWIILNKPRIITGCSTCLKMFRDNHPEIEVESIWNVISIPSVSKAEAVPMALSDPCTARYDVQTQKAVRKLLKTIGQPLVPLFASEEKTECCGFGGLMDNVNPSLSKEVTKNRHTQSNAPILTYCAMCRDQLALPGKQVFHLLDLLFPDIHVDSSSKKVPISQRRENRRQLLTEIRVNAGIEKIPKPPWQNISVHISEDVYEILNERKILRDDIQKVLHITNEANNNFSLGDTGSRLAFATLGEVTFWVQYHNENKTHIIEKGWSHRMKIRRRVT